MPLKLWDFHRSWGEITGWQFCPWQKCFFNSWPGYFYWLLLPWKLNILTHFPNRTVLFCSLRTRIHRNKTIPHCRSVLHSWRLFLMLPQWWSLPGSYIQQAWEGKQPRLLVSLYSRGWKSSLVSFLTHCLTMEENSKYSFQHRSLRDGRNQ